VQRAGGVDGAARDGSDRCTGGCGRRGRAVETARGAPTDEVRAAPPNPAGRTQSRRTMGPPTSATRSASQTAAARSSSTSGGSGIPGSPNSRSWMGRSQSASRPNATEAAPIDRRAGGEFGPWPEAPSSLLSCDRAVPRRSAARLRARQHPGAAVDPFRAAPRVGSSRLSTRPTDGSDGPSRACGRHHGTSYTGGGTGGSY
jgi:hypothetical protein